MRRIGLTLPLRFIRPARSMRMPVVLPPWLAVMLLATPAAAQFNCPAADRPIGIGPAYLDAVDGGRSLGVEGMLAWCRADYDTRPRLPQATYTGIEVDGAVPFSSLKLPQNVNASAWAGRVISLTERARDTGGDLDDMDSAFLFDYGVLGVGVRLLYEAGTDFEEQAVAGTGELRWVHPNVPWAPSVVLSVAAVRPVASELRDAVGAANDIHGRVGAHLYWLVPLGSVFEAEVDGRYFHGFGLDDLVAATGLDAGAFVSGRLSAALRYALGPIHVERLWVSYGQGQQPTDAVERKAWTLGLRLGAP
jgi:hypothetical protein